MTAGNKNYYSTVDRLWFWVDKDLFRVSMNADKKICYILNMPSQTLRKYKLSKHT